MTVGYGSPPVETRFQKGMSGNPSGRRKRREPKLEESILDVLSLQTGGQVSGKQRQLLTLEAMLRKAASSALKGEKRALKALWALILDVEDQTVGQPAKVIDMAAARARLGRSFGLTSEQIAELEVSPEVVTPEEQAYRQRCEAAIKRQQRKRAPGPPGRRKLFEA
ncbi:MAG TPA: DUF5681 domain-containing protein [Caulobacter sp.]|nr:DUF5681 domain-containing protein [Caulobacter sp.]